MKAHPTNRSQQRTFTVHLHQPVSPVRKGEILRAAVPLVWFVLGYIVCLLTRF